MKPLLSLKRTASTARSKNTTSVFYGKPITIREALEVTYELADYYQALKYNRAKMPKSPSPALGYLLRCNEMAKKHHTEINFGLKAGLKANYLDHDEVVWAWMYANYGNQQKPLITLGGLQLRFERKTIAV